MEDKRALDRIAVWRAGLTNRIEINPSVMLGKPVLRNTRIPVELVLRKLAERATVEEVLDAYPRLTADDVHACLAYAADAIAHEEVHNIGPDKISGCDSWRIGGQC
jgi:uncharacterized protein (DUF433 family)